MIVFYRHVKILFYFTGSLLMLTCSISAFANVHDAFTKSSWTKQSSGTSLSLTSVVWDGSQFVAVGHKGLVLTSSDGVSWRKEFSGTNSMLTSIVYAKGLKAKLIIGGEGLVMNSNNGYDWRILMGNKKFFMNNLIWADKLVMGISMGSPNLMISSNGVVWENVNIPGSMISATWSGEAYVGVGFLSKAFFSKDGLNWTVGKTGVPGALTDKVRSWLASLSRSNLIR